MPETQRNPIDQAIDARRRQLGWRWKDVYDRSGLSQETVRQIRHGLRDEAARTTDSEPRLEDTLGWARGSIQAIREGRQPTLADGAPRHLAAAGQTAEPYPDFVGADPFFRHIWDYTAAPEFERRGAIQGVHMVRELAASGEAGAAGAERRA